MDLQVVNPIEWAGWDDQICGLAHASIFHTAGWARVLHDSYGYEPIYFVVTNNGRFELVLPMMEVKSWLNGCRGVSLPFSDHCVPLVARPEMVADYWSEIAGFARSKGWKSIEFRGGCDYFKSKTSAVLYCSHILKLAEESELFKNMKDSNRRNIRKAIKEDVHIAADCSSEAMEEFYRLNCITRRKHGLPPQPKAFFANLFRHVMQNGMGNIFRANWQGRTVAASVFLNFGKQAFYKYGASDIEHLSLRANNLVMWEAIRHYADHGFESLDLGRSEPDNIGLCRYKLAWGAEERPLEYYHYDVGTERFIKGSLAECGWYNGIFSRMPMPLLKATGRLAYKHMG